MSNTLLVAGLGNPGLKYKKTRHNIGFRVLDEFQKENNFPKFKLDKKSRAEISKAVINDREVLLAKPQTFMNSSGISVKELSSLRNKELSSFQLVVIHDDFDLPFGEIKTSQASGAAGHHGIESIIQALGTNDFKRVRVGTRPRNEIYNPRGVVNLKAEDFVLKKFSQEEEKLLPQIIKNALDILGSLIPRASLRV